MIIGSNIPLTLKTQRKWVLLKLEDDGRKTPRQPNGHYAKINDPNTWTNYETVLESYYNDDFDGIAYAITEDDGISVVDIDKCIQDGKLSDTAKKVIELFYGTYIEYSMSNNGIHIWLKANTDEKYCKNTRLNIECYVKNRFMGVTGNVYGNKNDIIDMQANFDVFYKKYMKKDTNTKPKLDILEIAQNAKNGDDFLALYKGDTSKYSGDDSSADLALCCHLAFYTNKDYNEIDRLFRESGLYREKWERSDYRHSTITKAIELTVDTYKPKQSISEPESSELPYIQINGRPSIDIINDIIKLIKRKNIENPFLYKYLGGLATVTKDENDNYYIQDFSRSHLISFLLMNANFVKVNAKGEYTHVTALPSDIVSALLTADYELLPLEGITYTPIVCDNGDIIFQHGYNKKQKLFYDSNKINIEPFNTVTFEEVEEAVKVINDVFCDFPFVDSASKTHVIALMLTVILRNQFDNVPIFVIDAPTEGTGKSKLFKVCSLITTGITCETTFPSDPDELRKTLFSFLLSNKTLISFDNVSSMVKGSSLAAVVTSGTISARLLNTNRVANVKNSLTICVTGNNVQVDAETSRRSILIRMDAATARPDERQGFKYAELENYVMHNRNKLLKSLYVLIKAWYCNERFDYDVPVIGSFEKWCKTVGNILANAGINGFLENRHSLNNVADVETYQWEVFLQRFYDIYGTQEMSIKKLSTILKNNPNIEEVMPDSLMDCFKYDTPNIKRIGWLFRRIRDKRFTDKGYKVVSVMNGSKSLWCVVCDDLIVDIPEEPIENGDTIVCDYCNFGSAVAVKKKGNVIIHKCSKCDNLTYREVRN